MSNRAAALCLLAACACSCAPSAPLAPAAPTPPPAVAPPPDRSVIIVVWDGLRPDAVTPAETPNLVRLRAAG
ncbi:MAG TPA: hypothetical protein VK601_29070, partial [Kofleriaceae bacterium]|nr:hypothetical protein [Kofleriaceae bacterium]